MELRSTREMRRNEQLSRATARKSDTPAPSRPVQKQAPADRCTLSRQAMRYLERQRRLTQELEERRAREQAKWAGCSEQKSELDLLSKGLDVLDKCQKIAASIMRGDRVPMKDLQYLMDNDPDGYKLAIALRREKKDPEDVESVLDDEGKNGPAEDAEGGGESPSVSASEGSSGGEASATAE